MTSGEGKNAQALQRMLEGAGFQVSRVCCNRQSCFDFAAGKNGVKVLFKTYVDANACSARNAYELKVIAGCFSATPLIVSRKVNDESLEDDAVYTRHAVYVVTEGTVTNVACRSVDPLVYVGPGGYAVEVDGKLVEQRRRELGLSVGKLADMVGVSRRTVYGYEHGMTKASVASAYNLARALGIPVAKPIRILESTPKTKSCLVSRAKRAFGRRRVFRKILRKLTFYGALPVSKAPFDFVFRNSSENQVIVGLIVSQEDEGAANRMEETLSVCRVVNAKPVVVAEKPLRTSLDVTCIRTDYFRGARNLKALARSG